MNYQIDQQAKQEWLEKLKLSLKYYSASFEVISPLFPMIPLQRCWNN
jgi:hypothetical protein